jgi:hypothetical protein
MHRVSAELAPTVTPSGMTGMRTPAGPGSRWKLKAASTGKAAHGGAAASGRGPTWTPRDPAATTLTFAAAVDPAAGSSSDPPSSSSRETSHSSPHGSVYETRQETRHGAGSVGRGGSNGSSPAGYGGGSPAAVRVQSPLRRGPNGYTIDEGDGYNYNGGIGLSGTVSQHTSNTDAVFALSGIGSGMGASPVRGRFRAHLFRFFLVLFLFLVFFFGVFGVLLLYHVSFRPSQR